MIDEAPQLKIPELRRPFMPAVKLQLQPSYGPSELFRIVCKGFVVFEEKSSWSGGQDSRLCLLFFFSPHTRPTLRQRGQLATGSAVSEFL